MPTDEACARCHADIAAEWRASLHRRSWTNPYFLRAFAAEPAPFCRKCHAPGADPAADPPPLAREAGVGCTTCHVVPEGIVGSRALAAGGQGHAVLGDARLATPAACASCHEFDFPPTAGSATGPMQDTVGEHARSAASRTACQRCHMPLVPGPAGGMHHDHGFRVQGNPAMLAQGVVVERVELVGSAVRLAIAPAIIGHAFPTGDLFRQVEVRALPIDAKGAALAPASIEVLGRRLSSVRVGSFAAAQVELADTRLAPPGTAPSRWITLPVPVGTRRARWQIVWQRSPPWLAARLGLPEQETVAHEGVVSR